MNLILLQLKTDYRRFRGWLVAFWMLLLYFGFCRPFVHILQALPIMGFFQGINDVIRIFIFILGWLICVRVIQADPLVETNAFWMGRPIRRGYLVMAKTLFVVLFCVLPCFIAWNVSWWLGLNLVFGEWLHCVCDFTVMVFAFVLLPMIFAVITSKFSHFILHVAVFIFTLLVFNVVWDYLMRTDQVLQQGRETREYWLFIMMDCCLIFAWLAQWWHNGRKFVYIIWGVSLFLLPLLQKITPYEMLSFKPQPLPAAAGVSVKILTNNEVVPFENLVVGTHLGVTGLKSNQVAVANVFSGHFYVPQFKNGTSPAMTCAFDEYDGERQLNSWFMEIRSSLPGNVIWFSRLNAYSTKLPVILTNLAAEVLEGQKGWFEGVVDLKIYNVDKVGEVPLTTQSFTTSDGRRYWFEKTMKDERDINIIVKLQSYPAFMIQRLDWNNKQHCYVLYNPELGEAIFSNCVEQKALAVIDGGVTYIKNIPFFYPMLRSRLAGVSFDKWLKGARFLVYRVEADSGVHCNFWVNDYAFELDRSHYWDENTVEKK